MVTYTSQYPPAHNDTYVKATTKFDTNTWAYFATNPALSLTGTYIGTTWASVTGTNTNQRFHIDLGTAKIIRRIYYENFHSNGGTTIQGAKTFIFQGSNIEAGTFDDLVYANDGGWNNLATGQGTLDEHIAADQADPKYILVTNVNNYRYYAFKFADAWGGTVMGLRHIVLMTEDWYSSGKFLLNMMR